MLVKGVPSITERVCCPGGAAAARFAGSRLAFDFLHRDVFEGKRFSPGYETLRLVGARLRRMVMRSAHLTGPACPSTYLCVCKAVIWVPM